MITLATHRLFGIFDTVLYCIWSDSRKQVRIIAQVFTARQHSLLCRVLYSVRLSVTRWYHVKM